jgi:hypothetical protein
MQTVMSPATVLGMDRTYKQAAKYEKRVGGQDSYLNIAQNLPNHDSCRRVVSTIHSLT